MLGLGAQKGVLAARIDDLLLAASRVGSGLWKAVLGLQNGFCAAVGIGHPLALTWVGAEPKMARTEGTSFR